MNYTPLPFSQYFIDNSEDYNETGKARRKIEYKAATYQCSGIEKLLGLHHEVNYDIFYESDRDVIQINFQKTNGNSDWFANIAEFSSKYYDSIEFEGEKLQLRAHHGWAEMYKCIKHEIRDEWQRLKEEHPEAVTEVIGWSLGSGQAILCAQDLNYNFGVKPYVYTFGTVRPFKHTHANKKQMRKYLKSIYTVCYNFTNNEDIVTYMPPFYGFTMPRQVKIGHRKKTVKNLLNPLVYHTTYDQDRLYHRKSNKDAI